MRKVSRVCSVSGDMRVTVHPFHYAAERKACGNAIDISYRDLRRGFSGRLPDRAWIEGSLVCTCVAAKHGADRHDGTVVRMLKPAQAVGSRFRTNHR